MPGPPGRFLRARVSSSPRGHQTDATQARCLRHGGAFAMSWSRMSQLGLVVALAVCAGAAAHAAGLSSAALEAMSLVPISAPVEVPSIAPSAAAGVTGVMVALAIATLASEDLACVAAGALVAQGSLGLLPAVLGCAAGIFAGDFGLYVAGRIAARPLLSCGPVRRVLTPDRIARATAWLEARGTAALAASRFVPGARVATCVAAGMLGVRPVVVARVLAATAMVWTPLLVGGTVVATWWGGTLAPGAAVPAAIAAALVVLVLVRCAHRLATYEGRRGVVARWRRLTRWEFWPAWALYAPVVPWIAWLAVRYRSATVFTAANPGIDAAGFVGESKAAILEALARGRAPVAPFCLLRAAQGADARERIADRFLEAHGLPAVLKPDQGQRGTGVRIVRTRAALVEAARALAADHVLQAYVAGPEFGLFYVRRPHEISGRIVSLTAKHMARVVGDGRRSLDRLILDDARAVALGHVYRAVNAGRLAWIPAAGERVAICELGTHCRGAIFTDASALLTPDLERAVEASARAAGGFAFGRFDVRAASVADLRAGRFRILELNGVTSEPTHIYDPGASVWSAWRTLCRTWSLAFEIGHAHAGQGARVWSVRELVGCALAYRRFARGNARPAALSAPRQAPADA